MTAIIACTIPGAGHADDCPQSLRADPPPKIELGGLYYLANTGSWVELESGKVAFAGKRLELIFVPAADLCAEVDSTEPGKRPDCGQKGYAFVKTVKHTGAASDHSVTLARGRKYAAETHYRDFVVAFDQYQAFHKSDWVAASSIRTRWHETYVNNGEPRSTFEPDGKRLQYAFPDAHGEDELDGWRLARLLRFDTPEPGMSVCVPFDVTWNRPEMKLQLDFMLVDPVLDDFGFDPEHFELERDPG